jgi:AAA+ ATPase superfamily predicted ATPase
MENVVGVPARGEDFFQRDRDVQWIIGRLDSHNNLSIAAPRRVGKTSILYHLKDNGVGGHQYVYIDAEGIADEEDFYRLILKEIVKEFKSRVAKFMRMAGSIAKRIKTIKIASQEIEFDEAAHVPSYYEDLIELLAGLKMEGETKLVLLIDEFPQVIQNILKAKGEIAARQFLQTNRAMRIHPEVMLHVRFIVTGSTGLNYTVSGFNSTAFINDLNTYEIEPLSKEEAERFLREQFSSRDIELTPLVSSYLLQKLQWWSLFHLQIMIQELLRQRVSAIEISHVDQAFNDIISYRNESHFAHYKSRLYDQFKGPDLEYALLALQRAAVDGQITFSELKALAATLNMLENFRRIIQVLIYDGYVNDGKEENIFRFNSPIVRLWWRKFICN